MKCDACGRGTAVIHLIEIKDGRRVDRNLCEPCAMEAEAGVGRATMPIQELLQRFVDDAGRQPPDRAE